MIRSMTGYGRGEDTLHGRKIQLELRSVNNRYLDCNVKIPRNFIFAEEQIKAIVQERISRGKVDVFVTLEGSAAERVTVSLNQPLADGYYAALSMMKEQYALGGEITVSLLSRFSDLLTLEKEAEDLETAADDICQVLRSAIEDFNRMREREGEKLAADIQNRSAAIAALLEQIEARAPQTLLEYRTKLTRRMAELLENTQIDENRILIEAAIFADKSAIDEETIRLRSHLSQLEEILASGGIVGRKLDFLIQEFNREANTIGSKSSDLEITRLVVEIKGEIEKIREQVQNIE